MDTATPDVSVESSPASQQQAAPDFASFREQRNAADIATRTGKAPVKPSHTEDSAPSDNSSADGADAPEEKPAPASEAGKKAQESKRTDANSRIRELIAERKALEERLARYEQGKPDVKPESSPAPKQQPKPAEQPKALEAPKKPKLEDFKGDDAWQQFEDARDKYYEDLADFKAASRLEAFQAQQAELAQQRALQQQISSAGERYGEEAQGAIGQAVEALTAQDIPKTVRDLVNESPVLVDLLYVAGSKPEELASFVELAKTNPSQAIRKIAVMEHLIQQEHAKGSAGKEAPARGEDGKFVSATPPEKPKTKAPPIGTEVSGRGSAPPDAIEQAVKDGDFRTFRERANARDIARRRGQ